MRPDQALRLKQGRLNANLTQEQASTQLNVATSTLKDWEKADGAEPATTAKMIEICNLYGISLDWWLTGTTCGPTISEKEQLVLSKYRQLPKEAKNGLEELLKAY